MEGKRLLGAVFGLVFAAACGSATTTTSASAGAASAAPTATPAPTVAATAQSAAGPKLTDLLTAAKSGTYKITYKISGTGPGVSVSDTEQTWYLKPPRSRFDMSLSISGQTMSVSVFNLPEGQFSCSGGGGAPTSCFAIRGAGSPTDQNSVAMTQQDLIDNPGKYLNTFKETRTFAGIQGHCYEIKQSAAGATGLEAGVFCYSKEGIALYSQFKTQGSSWTMEATKVSTSVSDADFVLPAKPISY